MTKRSGLLPPEAKIIRTDIAECSGHCPVPAGMIDDIVCRNVPKGAFPATGSPDADRRFRFSVDVFARISEPPQRCGFCNGLTHFWAPATWVLVPTGAPLLEEIPAKP